MSKIKVTLLANPSKNKSNRQKNSNNNWPRYWNGKRWVSGTAAALHYIKENTKEGHFKGLLEETGEKAIKEFVAQFADKLINEASKPKLKRYK